MHTKGFVHAFSQILPIPVRPGISGEIPSITVVVSASKRVHVHSVASQTADPATLFTYAETTTITGGISPELVGPNASA